MRSASSLLAAWKRAANLSEAGRMCLRVLLMAGRTPESVAEQYGVPVAFVKHL